MRMMRRRTLGARLSAYLLWKRAGYGENSPMLLLLTRLGKSSHIPS
ncbi:hypothetical protein LINPERPRIM_LOCUS14006 [Linum perenne]